MKSPIETEKFVGFRVTPEVLDGLKEAARTRGQTVSALCVEAVELLLSDDPERETTVHLRRAAQVASHADDSASQLIEQVRDLQTRYDKIKAEVEEKSGFFSDAPAPLVAAKKLLERQLEALTAKLAQLRESVEVPTLPKAEASTPKSWLF